MGPRGWLMQSPHERRPLLPLVPQPNSLCQKPHEARRLGSESESGKPAPNGSVRASPTSVSVGATTTVTVYGVSPSDTQLKLRYASGLARHTPVARRSRG